MKPIFEDFSSYIKCNKIILLFNIHSVSQAGKGTSEKLSLPPIDLTESDVLSFLRDNPNILQQIGKLTNNPATNQQFEKLTLPPESGQGTSEKLILPPVIPPGPNTPGELFIKLNKTKNTKQKETPDATLKH